MIKRNYGWISFLMKPWRALLRCLVSGLLSMVTIIGGVALLTAVFMLHVSDTLVHIGTEKP